MRKWIVVSALVLALTVVLSAGTWAQQKSAVTTKSEMKTAEGKITAVDQKAKSLTATVEGVPMTFNWSRSTKITESGHAVKPSALVVGANVSIKYQEKGGKNLAREIVITPATAPAPAKK